MSRLSFESGSSSERGRWSRHHRETTLSTHSPTESSKSSRTYRVDSPTPSSPITSTYRSIPSRPIWPTSTGSWTWPTAMGPSLGPERSGFSERLSQVVAWGLASGGLGMVDRSPKSPPEGDDCSVPSVVRSPCRHLHGILAQRCSASRSRSECQTVDAQDVSYDNHGGLVNDRLYLPPCRSLRDDAGAVRLLHLVLAAHRRVLGHLPKSRPGWWRQDAVGPLRDHPAVPRHLCLSHRPWRKDAGTRRVPGGSAAEDLRRLRQGDGGYSNHLDGGTGKAGRPQAAGRHHRRRVRNPESKDPRLRPE